MCGQRGDGRWLGVVVKRQRLVGPHDAHVIGIGGQQFGQHLTAEEHRDSGGAGLHDLRVIIRHRRRPDNPIRGRPQVRRIVPRRDLDPALPQPVGQPVEMGVAAGHLEPARLEQEGHASHAHAAHADHVDMAVRLLEKTTDSRRGFMSQTAHTPHSTPTPVRQKTKVTEPVYRRPASVSKDRIKAACFRRQAPRVLRRTEGSDSAHVIIAWIAFHRFRGSQFRSRLRSSRFFSSEMVMCSSA